jgi:hypothetical protein
MARGGGRLGDGVGGDGRGDGQLRDDEQDAGDDGRLATKGGSDQQDGAAQEGRLPQKRSALKPARGRSRDR